MKKNIFILILLFVFASSYAQEQSKQPFVRLSSFQISQGIGVQNIDHSVSFEDFKKISSDQDIFNRDLSDYNTNTLFGNNSFVMPHFEALAGFQFLNKNKSYNPQRELQIGIGFGQYQIDGFSFFKHEAFATDTFVSGTGEQIIRDSIRNYHQYYDHYADMMTISVNYMFKSNTTKRLYAYTGIGLRTGFSLNSVVESGYHESERSEIRENNSLHGHISYWGYDNEDSEYDNRDAHSIFTANLHLQFGLNMRISNKREFWKHWNVYTNYGIGLNYMDAGPDFSSTGIGHNIQFGVRYTLDGQS